MEEEAEEGAKEGEEKGEGKGEEDGADAPVLGRFYNTHITRNTSMFVANRLKDNTQYKPI